MVKLTHSTKSTKANTISRQWHLIDLSGQVLGRAIPKIAYLLQGKNKVNYSPNLDSGDFVVVINIKKVVITGRKSESKKYTYFSGYPGGLRTRSYKDLQKDKPGEIVRHAVSGMLPKNKLRDKRLKRLFTYTDDNHPYYDKLKIVNNKNG